MAPAADPTVPAVPAPPAPGHAPTTEQPFFVYGTLLPGEPNHDMFIRGRSAREETALLRGAVLYDGPGYPYAIDGDAVVHGTLVTAAPDGYRELLALLDSLEEFLGPGHPRNLYERVTRAVELPDGRTVLAWVYLAAAAVTRSLHAGGVPIPDGRWLTRRPPPPGPRTP
ncbi:gamma-glutamylcyclotransferase family protein [uncultured Streptomyces sp.]|uniref:gamma-glutamylcyclotransferase family protein n=1 Tax=uncultured Streptomyces sp. TaxID=174707 RepID=UPI0026104DDB|nr:gamma-glutamylcyclotransferase family protein [uncultured Streptomyces sp.]